MLEPGRSTSWNAQRAHQLRLRCIGTVRSQTQSQINYPMETELTPTVQKAGWAPFLVWMGTQNFAPTAVQSLDHPAQSKSLYYLRYPSPRYL